MNKIDHIAGHTYHSRKGAIENAFRYSVDFILFDPENLPKTPYLFSFRRANLMNWRDRDHGGSPGEGQGVNWLRSRLEEMGLPSPSRILLLTQPRVLGHVFNPVSFWLCLDPDAQLFAVIAEVTNTYGTRHSYVCHKPDLSPIQPEDRIVADKKMHVSPFQKIEGTYSFRFDFRPDRVGVMIDYSRKDGGLVATLTGLRAPLTNRSILTALVRRPFGARRGFALILWQALKLWIKKATFRPFRTAPVPEQPVSRPRM